MSNASAIQITEDGDSCIISDQSKYTVSLIHTP